MQLEVSDHEAFRAVMSRYATGVVVVSVCTAGIDHAMTANSFTSVSLDPPLVLVCIDKSSRFHQAVIGADAWAVSILGEPAHRAARWFATRGRPLDDQFAGFPARRAETTGALVLSDAQAVVECRTEAVHPGGDHDILVGRVVSLALAQEETNPLLFYRHGFRSLAVGPGPDRA